MIVLDTHALIWWMTDSSRLSRPALKAIQKHARAGTVAIASVTLWELAWLLARERIKSQGTVHQTVHEYVDRSRATVLEISPEIAVTAAQLSPLVPADPGDRLIVATALVHAIPLVTKDARIQDSHTCKTVW